MDPNDARNVSPAMGLAGGYLLSAPRVAASAIERLGEFTRALPASFENLGYVSADGIRESESAESEQERDVDGNPVGVTLHDRTETVRVRLLELRGPALAEAHGHGNVESEPGLVTVHHNGARRSRRTYLCDLVLRDGRRWRKVIPDGQVTEVGELQIAGAEPAGREIAIACGAVTWLRGDAAHTDTVVDFIEAEGADSVPPLSARLRGLLSTCYLSPPFRPWATEYSVETGARGLVVRATRADAGATVSARRIGDGMISQVAVTSGADCYVDTPNEGSYIVEIAVANASAGTRATYRLAVTHERRDSGVATLAWLRIEGASLEPFFSPSTYEYRARVASATAKVRLQTTDGSATVRLSANGSAPVTVPAESPYAPGWERGENRLVAEVALGERRASYAVTITY